MLTISKPLSAGQAQNYHHKEFTAKEQNYWSQSGVIAGEWQGQLATQFGLAGAVSAEDFAKLSQGQHSQTGEQLGRRRSCSPDELLELNIQTIRSRYREIYIETNAQVLTSVFVKKRRSGIFCFVSWVTSTAHKSVYVPVIYGLNFVSSFPG